MGRNAQARRTLKLAAKNDAPQTTRRTGETKTYIRLRARLAECTSQQQLEEIIRTFPEGHCVHGRDLIYRLAPKDLPCCHRARVSKQRGEVPVVHGAQCPVGGTIILPSGGAGGF